MKSSDYLKELYRPPLSKPRSDDYLCLEKNEPPFSAFECVDNIFSNEDMKNLRIYPNLYELYEKLAIFSNVEIENILLTQGSEQAIKNIFEVFVEENDEVVYYFPSFAMYDVFAYQKKASIKYLEFDKNGNMSIDDILKTVTKNTRLFSIINPHNFTGKYISYEELEIIVKHTAETDTIFLLDEAYYHYYNTNSIQFIKEYDHVIITRTFSKALGIPGARVGYALASQNTIELLRKVKPIDDIDYLGGHIAKKVLDSADEILNRNISQVKKWQLIFKNSKITNIEYIETYANYILLKSNDYEYHKNLFIKNKIVIKFDFGVECLKDCLRFSIVDDKNMNRILELLEGEKE